MASFLGRPSVGAFVTQGHVQSIVEFGMREADSRLLRSRQPKRTAGFVSESGQAVSSILMARQRSRNGSAPRLPAPGPSACEAFADELIPKRSATTNDNAKFASKPVFITISDWSNLESAFVQ